MVSPSAVSPNSFSQLSSGDASDSICPKGWGMGGQYSDGNYNKLMTKFYLGKELNFLATLKYQDFNRSIHVDEALKSFPLSFVNSGTYQGSTQYARSTLAFLMEKWLESTKISKNLYITNVIVSTVYGTNKNAYGNFVRCVAKSLKLKREN